LVLSWMTWTCLGIFREIEFVAMCIVTDLVVGWKCVNEAAERSTYS
jgi:hypothetical protein